VAQPRLLTELPGMFTKLALVGTYGIASHG
jgi:hypothetical protein